MELTLDVLAELVRLPLLWCLCNWALFSDADGINNCSNCCEADICIGAVCLPDVFALSSIKESDKGNDAGTSFPLLKSLSALLPASVVLLHSEYVAPDRGVESELCSQSKRDGDPCWFVVDEDADDIESRPLNIMFPCVALGAL